MPQVQAFEKSNSESPCQSKATNQQGEQQEKTCEMCKKSESAMTEDVQIVEPNVDLSTHLYIVSIFDNIEKNTITKTLIIYPPPEIKYLADIFLKQLGSTVIII